VRRRTGGAVGQPTGCAAGPSACEGPCAEEKAADLPVTTWRPREPPVRGCHGPAVLGEGAAASMRRRAYRGARRYRGPESQANHGMVQTALKDGQVRWVRRRAHANRRPAPHLLPAAHPCVGLMNR
jgi:hypothetical protein